MSKQNRQMIEVTVKNNSPWKSAMADALKTYFENWGYHITRFQNGDEEVFVGIEREVRR